MVKETVIDIFGPPQEIVSHVSHHSNFIWIYSWVRTCFIYFCIKWISSHSIYIISNSFELVRGKYYHLQSCALYYFWPLTNMVCSHDRVLWVIPAWVAVEPEEMGMCCSLFPFPPHLTHCSEESGSVGERETIWKEMGEQCVSPLTAHTVCNGGEESEESVYFSLVILTALPLKDSCVHF